MKIKAMQKMFPIVAQSLDNISRFYVNQGTEKEELYLVLDEKERFSLCEKEIKTQLFYLEPKYIAGFCQIPELEGLFPVLTQDLCRKGIEAFSALLFRLISRKLGDWSLFVDSMIRLKGAGFFLASFSGKEIQLEYGLFAYRLD